MTRWLRLYGLRALGVLVIHLSTQTSSVCNQRHTMLTTRAASSTSARHLMTYGRSRVEGYVDHRATDSLCATTTSPLHHPLHPHPRLFLLFPSLFSSTSSLASSLSFFCPYSLATWRATSRTTGNLTGAL